MNGFQAPGKECGSLAIMIIGAVGWQDIMKIAKPQDTMRIEGFGSKDITGLIKSFQPELPPPLSGRGSNPALSSMLAAPSLPFRYKTPSKSRQIFSHFDYYPFCNIILSVSVIKN
jgi:hypothetical protein